MRPLMLNSPHDDYAILKPNTDPSSVMPFAESHRSFISPDGDWWHPLRLQFEQPIPYSLLEAVGVVLERYPDVELYAYGNADPTLRWVDAVAAVETLSLNLYAVTSFAPLRRLRRLRSLSLPSTASHEPSLDFLEDLPQLEELDITAQSKGFASVGALRELRRLQLRSVRVKSIDVLRDHPRLEVLWVHTGSLRDFSPLASIPTFRALELWQLRMMTSEDLNTLSDCSHLEAMSLGALRNVAHLHALTGGSADSLKYVIVEGLRGLGSYDDFARMTLRELYVDTSRALDGRLEAFVDHPTLRCLTLSERFPDDEVERLQRTFRGDYLYANGRQLVHRGARPRVGWRTGVTDVLRIPTSSRRYIGADT